MHAGDRTLSCALLLFTTVYLAVVYGSRPSPKIPTSSGATRRKTAAESIRKRFERTTGKRSLLSPNRPKKTGVALESAEETLRDVEITPPPSPPPSLQLIHMSFVREKIRPEPISWGIALDDDYVGVLLYHRGRQNTPLMLIRQFRPPVFVHRVRQLPENVGKPVTEIQWSQYSVKYGEALELCGGMMDKQGKSPKEVAQEEIIEECGSDIGYSGTSTHLFFAEIDEGMRSGRGGGLAGEGELIKNVFLSLDEARDFVAGKRSADVPPSVLYALAWFLQEKRR